MKTIAHVPVQTLKEWNLDDLLGRWFPTSGEFKTMLGAVLIMVLGCLILLCLLPLVMHSISTLIKASERKNGQLYLLQGYQRVNPIPKKERDDAF
jgi:hypothetical protein